jgi:hypothetical protein
MKDDRNARRFAFIETRLFWGNGLTARELGDAFGIARPNAQAVLEAYRRQYPDNLRYDRQRKRHVMTERFVPRYISGDPYLFLDYQRGMALAGYYHAADDWADLPFYDADRQLRPRLEIEAVRVVLAALRQSRTVRVIYLAKERTSQRILSPHHLVYADNRYHLRAYCHFRQRWLDFVLSRIKHAEIATADWISEEYDEDWTRMETLTFSLNSDSPHDTQASLRQAYVLDDENSLVITTRRALSRYVIRRMTRLDARLNIPLWVHMKTANQWC